MKYEELHEIRKMTRRGYQESLREEKTQVEAVKEAGDDARQKDAAELGYGEADLAVLPEGIDVLEGCGNPLAALEIKPGSSILVAGCRGGADCFLAAVAAGPKGHVVGVEENPEEVTKARQAARAGKAGTVEIRPGECENLPAADKSFDVVITNCAVTFSYDKARVIKELARVLKSGGRLMLCEPAIPRETAAGKRRAATKAVECLENAFNKEEVKAALKRAGFKKISIVDETPFPAARILRDRRVRAAVAAGEMTEETAGALAAGVVTAKTTAIRP